MKKLATACVVFCLSVPSFAAPSHHAHAPQKAPAPAVTPESLAIDVDFDYQQNKKGSFFHQDVINNNLMLKTAQHAWTVIQDEQPSPGEDLILLGRIQSANGDEVTMNFLVLETGEKPQLISRPVLKMKYNQRAQLAINEGSRILHLTVTARS